MFHETVLPAAADGATVLVAGLAWVRVRRLNALAAERRLARLGDLFLLLALAVLVRLVNWAVWEWRGVGGARTGSFELVDALFWLHHALLVLAIVFASLAVGGRHRADSESAVMAPLLLGAAPVLVFAEGLGFAYLALRTGINHIRRSNVGSLQVTLGFFLLAAAWLVPLIVYDEGIVPLGPPHWITAVMGLAGTIALAAALPRGGKAPG